MLSRGDPLRRQFGRTAKLTPLTANSYLTALYSPALWNERVERTIFQCYNGQAMPRGRRERSPRYQLSLDLEFDRARSETVAAYREAALDLAAQASDSGRFVRTVQEEVVVRSPAEAAGYLAAKVYTPFDQFEQEEFWVLLLNTKNRVTHAVMVYRGTVDTIYVRVAEIFKEAIRKNAASILLSHCHPSGEPTPSSEDVRVTEMVGEAGKLLDIDLVDHIVVGNQRWISMKERGLGFKP